MPNYSNGKIYKISITINGDNNMYIGSTCSSLGDRFARHRSQSRLARRSIGKLYQHINNVGFDNIVIELIESYPCANKRELRLREQHYIDIHFPS